MLALGLLVAGLLGEGLHAGGQLVLFLQSANLGLHLEDRVVSGADRASSLIDELLVVLGRDLSSRKLPWVRQQGSLGYGARLEPWRLLLAPLLKFLHFQELLHWSERGHGHPLRRVVMRMPCRRHLLLIRLEGERGAPGAPMDPLAAIAVNRYYTM